METIDTPIPTLADVLDALATQSRVVMALVLRETLSRYGQQKLGFLWALVEPTIVITAFAIAMSMIRGDDPGGMPMVLFMITGYVPFAMFRDPMTQMQGAITANRTLLGFPQVTTFDVILARSVLECAVLFAVFPMILAGAWLFGSEIRVEDPLGVLAACALLMLLGTGFGFLFAALTPVVPSTRQITAAILGRPLFLSSGLFFTAESIPSPLRDWMLFNPVLHLVELLRSAFFVEFESAHGDWRYASLWAVGAFAFGLLVHQSLRRRAIVGV